MYKTQANIKSKKAAQIHHPEVITSHFEDYSHTSLPIITHAHTHTLLHICDHTIPEVSNPIFPHFLMS